ncbi:hypothetical protein SmJEL517_g05620 [Synchytrium microbalum]|uniref:Uncharacterized protein n=1 Tax=Synchytrium microbalum TaxID=1806994 RepID=A0A507BUH7_9FUNG|nr:uncharacterized protein SmJEL517_g05620 [Synchytrium microbalum]TPX30948.1 hypothetical protein SmJEL517_g05620 [Synchytrium microbalum]
MEPSFDDIVSLFVDTFNVELSKEEGATSRQFDICFQGQKHEPERHGLGISW